MEIEQFEAKQARKVYREKGKTPAGKNASGTLPLSVRVQNSKIQLFISKTMFSKLAHVISIRIFGKIFHQTYTQNSVRRQKFANILISSEKSSLVKITTK